MSVSVLRCVYLLVGSTLMQPSSTHVPRTEMDWRDQNTEPQEGLHDLGEITWLKTLVCDTLTASKLQSCEVAQSTMARYDCAIHTVDLNQNCNQSQ